MTSERTFGALRAVDKFKRALRELERLDRRSPSEADQLVTMLGEFVADWRAVRSN